jgi:hypothetical protein
VLAESQPETVDISEHDRKGADLSVASNGHLTADCGEYNITAYVLAIHYHILNSLNNRKLQHIHHPI